VAVRSDQAALAARAARCFDEKNLAEASKHLCPSLAAAELAKLKIDAEVFITHLKPGESDLTMREIAENIEELGLKFRPKMLMNNQILEF